MKASAGFLCCMLSGNIWLVHPSIRIYFNGAASGNEWLESYLVNIASRIWEERNRKIKSLQRISIAQAFQLTKNIAFQAVLLKFHTKPKGYMNQKRKMQHYSFSDYEWKEKVSKCWKRWRAPNSRHTSYLHIHNFGFNYEHLFSHSPTQVQKNDVFSQIWYECLFVSFGQFE